MEMICNLCQSKDIAFERLTPPGETSGYYCQDCGGFVCKEKTSKIDYKYIHDRKCELIEYIESRSSIRIPEQIELKMLSILQRVAFNENHRTPAKEPEAKETPCRKCKYSDIVDMAGGYCTKCGPDYNFRLFKKPVPKCEICNGEGMYIDESICDFEIPCEDCKGTGKAQNQLKGEMIMELLPCPFCGKDAMCFETSAGFRVKCIDNKCIILPFELRSAYKTKEIAFQKWNHRTPAKEPEACPDDIWDMLCEFCKNHLSHEGKAQNQLKGE